MIVIIIYKHIEMYINIYKPLILKLVRNLAKMTIMICKANPKVVFILYLQAALERLKIAIIGQSQFGAEVYKLLSKNEHKIVGVFTIPDTQGRADPLGK